MFKPTSSYEFQSWFDGSSVINPNGQPLMVHHGTTEIKVVPGECLRGDASALAELQAIAEMYGIPEVTSVPAIFERWIEMGMASSRGVKDELAKHARTLLEKSRPHVRPPSEILGFESFAMPYGEKELGVHFGSITQASGFGNVFDFYLRIVNPLRLPDLGTWHYQSVIRESRKRGVSISDGEYSAVFNARDNNEALRDLLLAKGIDGIVYSNEAEGAGDSFIVFRSHQIISASDMNIAWAKVPAEVAGIWAAERMLKKLELDILTDEQIEFYADHRFDNGAMNPIVEPSQLKWVAYTGYLQKHFYVHDPEGAEAGILRTAYFYPEGAEGDRGNPRLVLEDEMGQEIASILCERYCIAGDNANRLETVEVPSP